MDVDAAVKIFARSFAFICRNYSVCLATIAAELFNRPMWPEWNIRLRRCYLGKISLHVFFLFTLVFS